VGGKVVVEAGRDPSSTSTSSPPLAPVPRPANTHTHSPAITHSPATLSGPTSGTAWASGGGGGGSKASPLSLTSLKAAWRSLTGLGSGAARLPHLERTDGSATQPHDYRYTHFPGGKRHKETALDNTHIHLTPYSRTYTHPHRSPTIGVRLHSQSDQNLHKVCLAHTARTNSVFSAVHLSGGSGDSCGSSGSCTRRSSRHNRSRSLERQQGARVHPTPLPPHARHTRSLERNHKFRVHLRPLPDDPPSHQAPPPPTLTPTHLPWAPDAVEGVSGVGHHQGGQGVGVQQGHGGQEVWVGGMEGGHAGGGGGSFINKPARGWLHPDHQLADEGVCYGVRYIGCLEVNTSMKSLNFDTRSLIAKECISKVCEAAGLKTADRKRKVVKTISRILGERPVMEYAGSNVNLTITSTALTLSVLESGQVVASHDMPNISFASGGDPDTLDFIAYVAKDSRYGRACFVLECGGGLAQDVITTIGQAFELRFKEYLKRTPSVQYTSLKSDNRPGVNGEGCGWGRDDPEYYNDLPGKVPPDMPPPPVPPLPQYSASDSKRPNLSPSPASGVQAAAQAATHSGNSGPPTSASPVPGQTTTAGKPIVNSHQPLTNKVSDNLIDLTCEGTQPGGATLRSEPEYVNDAVIKQKQLMDQRDPFDMQPFSMQLSQLSGGGTGAVGGASGATGVSSGGTVGGVSVGKPLPLNQRLQLQREPWYHGPISRKEAEMLMVQDGDFLVRESQGTAGQYVLTGMQNNTKKHLLLVDPEGVVRTKSRTFDSVSHLIIFHRDNELPIVSAESALLLRNPVLRRPR
ncbi:hypothetical protein Pcinc_038425, partial [Petrolisthes cinctipes]